MIERRVVDNAAPIKDISHGVDRNTILTYIGDIADSNGRGVVGARLLSNALANRLGLSQTLVGHRTPVPDCDYHSELAAGAPSLTELQVAHRQLLASQKPALVVMPRCAGALATLPNLAETGTTIVWFDAHADFNTPASTPTGYLGGMVLSAVVGWWDSGFGKGLLPDDIVLGGTRALDSFEELLIEDEVIRCATGASMLEDLDAYVGNNPIYFHFDCDVLEPGIVPVEFEVRDGLLLSDLNAVAQRLAQNPIVGIELAEFEAPAMEDEIDGTGSGLLDALDPLLKLI